MRKYTFIAEYKNGTYISQYSAMNINEALSLWVNNLDNKYFSTHKKQKIEKEIFVNNFWPIAIDGVENVWCQAYLSGKYFLLLNIVETV